MKKLLILFTITVMFIMSSCTSSSSSYSYTPSYTKTYSFGEISNQSIMDTILNNCFEYRNQQSTPCSLRGATVDTFFKRGTFGGVKIKSLKKYQSLSDTEGIVLFYMQDSGILFDVTLFVVAQVSFNKYTGEVTKVRALDGKTVGYSKSQDLIDSEPALGLMKDGLNATLKSAYGVELR